MPSRRRKKSGRKKKRMNGDQKTQNDINRAEVIVNPQNPLSNLPKPLLIGGLILILAITAFVSYSLGSSKSQPASDQQKEPVVKEAELPLPVSTLQNPIIYEWQGSVEGKLVAKTDQNFTLEKEGNKLNITIKENYTYFRKEGALGTPTLTISDVPIGAYVRGIVWLAAKDKVVLTETAGDIVGGVFSFSSPE